jgi:hypothetical protein
VSTEVELPSSPSSKRTSGLDGKANDGNPIPESAPRSKPPPADGPAPASTAPPASARASASLPPPSYPPASLPPASIRPRESLVKPLLASEALMEDLAPVEPWRDAARIWCAAVGIGVAAFGLFPVLGVQAGGMRAAAPSFVLGAVALVAALARVSYRQRAVAMLVLGLLCAVTGLGGAGPASGISVDGGGAGLARIAAATALPAALIFRARYRAYAGARWLLASAFVLTFPFVLLLVSRFVPFTADGATMGSMVALVLIVASLVGFMGSETTGAGTYVGAGVLSGVTLELLLSALGRPGATDGFASVADILLGAVVFAATAGLAALGLFQILAWRFSADARRIDLHARIKEPSKRPPQPSSDWSTRS